eukprot:scaffold98084_cov36-Attheya_sp.AAC.1
MAATASTSNCNSVMNHGREGDDEASISSHYELIIWLFNYNRHFDFLNNISNNDIPWHKKKPLAVWREKPIGKHFNHFKMTDPLPCPSDAHSSNGNIRLFDVVSGLKWMLTPKITSYATEEELLLQPWVHYTPIKDALCDLKEKAQDAVSRHHSEIIEREMMSRMIKALVTDMNQALCYFLDGSEEDILNDDQELIEILDIIYPTG